MPSEKQLAANRANAQKSTGPKTEEGKQRSRMNALRHGLTAQVTLMTGEDRDAHDKFVNAFVADLAPEGAVETHLALTIAHDAWRLNRIHAIEENRFADGFFQYGHKIDTEHPQIHAALVQSLTFHNEALTFEKLSLYEQRLDRKFQRNLKLFLEMKADRLKRLEAEPPKTMTAGSQAPPIAEAGPLPAPASSPNGFVLSDPLPPPEPAPQPLAATPPDPARRAA
jgi:hypothetical protein